ncbi:MAG: 50S ribosomal protein L11 methyltransferase [Anaerolineae bacterium]
MNWIEIKLSHVDGEAAEAVAELLQRYGHQGVSVEQEGIMPELYTEDEVPPPRLLTVRAYLPDDERVTDAKHQLEQGLAYMNMMYPMPTPEYTLVKEEDWSEAWKANYHPIRIGQRTLVRPLWITDVEIRPDDIEIALDPGMAFGTGTHPTTQLCLEALESAVQPGQRVLDLGTGSGILAIAAAKLGAAQVLALDIEPFAIRATIENAAQNGVAEKITAQQGSLDTVLTSARRFDLIVVNILARIIIAMCQDGLGQVVRPGGTALFSGLIDTQVDEVEAALRETGLTPTGRRQQGDWMVIEATRPHNA